MYICRTMLQRYDKLGVLLKCIIDALVQNKLPKYFILILHRIKMLAELFVLAYRFSQKLRHFTLAFSTPCPKSVYISHEPASAAMQA